MNNTTPYSEVIISYKNFEDAVADIYADLDLNSIEIYLISLGLETEGQVYIGEVLYILEDHEQKQIKQ